MSKMSLSQLYSIKEKMEEIGISDNDNYNILCEKIKNIESVMEDGMGAVVSSQPSSLAGATIGTNWSSCGGTTGSGDVSVPYNTGTGTKNVSHKIPVMGYNHGARTGKKSRVKKLDMKALRDTFAKRKDKLDSGDGEVKRKPKVMSFNDFQKNDMNTIKK